MAETTPQSGTTRAGVRAFDPQTGMLVEVAPDAMTGAFRDGKLHVVKDLDYVMRAPDGALFHIPAASVAQAVNQGYGFADRMDALRAQAQGEGWRAAADGAFAGATLGAGDAIQVKAFGVDPDEIAARAEVQQGARTLGEIGGVGTQMLLTGGFGAGGSVARAAAETALLERGVGTTLAKLSGHAAGGALEGATFGAGTGMSEAALGRSDDVAEHMIAGAGAGALLGGAMGAGLEAATSAAGWATKGVTARLKDYADLYFKGTGKEAPKGVAAILRARAEGGVVPVSNTAVEEAAGALRAELEKVQPSARRAGSKPTIPAFEPPPPIAPEPVLRNVDPLDAEASAKAVGRIRERIDKVTERVRAKHGREVEAYKRKAPQPPPAQASFNFDPVEPGAWRPLPPDGDLVAAAGRGLHDSELDYLRDGMRPESSAHIARGGAGSSAPIDLMAEVGPDGQYRWHLIDGRHRLQHAQQEGLPHVKANIRVRRVDQRGNAVDFDHATVTIPTPRAGIDAPLAQYKQAYADWAQGLQRLEARVNEDIRVATEPLWEKAALEVPKRRAAAEAKLSAAAARAEDAAHAEAHRQYVAAEREARRAYDARVAEMTRSTPEELAFDSAFVKNGKVDSGKVYSFVRNIDAETNKSKLEALSAYIDGLDDAAAEPIRKALDDAHGVASARRSYDDAFAREASMGELPAWGGRSAGAAVGGALGGPVGAAAGAALGGMAANRAMRPLHAEVQRAAIQRIMTGVREHIGARADALAGIASKAARYGQNTARLVPSTAAMLHGSPTQRDSAFRERAAEVQAFMQNPGLVSERMAEATAHLDGVPDAAGLVQVRAGEALAYLASIMPTGTNADSMSDEAIVPAYAQHRFARVDAAIQDPMRVLEDDATAEEVRAVAKVYPRLHASMVNAIIESVGKNPNLPWDRRRFLAAVWDLPTHRAFDPARIRISQNAYAPPPKGPGRPPKPRRYNPNADPTLSEVDSLQYRKHR